MPHASVCSCHCGCGRPILDGDECDHDPIYGEDGEFEGATLLCGACGRNCFVLSSDSADPFADE